VTPEERARKLIGLIGRYVRAEISAAADTEPDSMGAYHEEEQLREAFQELFTWIVDKSDPDPRLLNPDGRY